MAGFKSEWATVRAGLLYIGGLGKEWTTSEGEMVNNNPQWIKTVDTHGRVLNYNWTDKYIKLRDSVDIHFPGGWEGGVGWKVGRVCATKGGMECCVCSQG